MAKRKKKGKAPMPKKEQRTWTPTYIIVAALLAAVMLVSVITPLLSYPPVPSEDDHIHDTVPYFVDGQWYVYNEDHGHFEGYPGTEDMVPYEEDGVWYVYDEDHGHYHPTGEVEDHQSQ